MRSIKSALKETAEWFLLDQSAVKALAAEGAQKSAEIVTKSHLSLTGASGKVGLYYDEAGDQWYVPGGSAPSTHIVKQSHVRLEGNNGDGFVSVPMFHTETQNFTLIETRLN